MAHSFLKYTIVLVSLFCVTISLAQTMTPYAQWLSEGGLSPSLMENPKLTPGSKSYTYHAKGRYLAAASPISANDTIVSVPLKTLAFSSSLADEFPAEVLTFLNTKMNNAASDNDKLTLALIYHRFMLGEKSKYIHYLTTLPGKPSLVSQLPYWTEEAIKEIPPGLEILKESKKNVDERRVALQEVCLKLASTVDPSVTEERKQALCSEDILKWAIAIVYSRSWRVGRGLGVALLPVIDLFDHSQTGNALKIEDENRESGVKEGTEQKWFARVYADKDYKPGEEVYLNYHYGLDKYVSSITMVTNYGFLPDASEWKMKLGTRFVPKSLFDNTIAAVRKVLGCTDIEYFDLTPESEKSDIEKLLKCMRAEFLTPKELDDLAGAISRNQNVPFGRFFDGPVSVENELIVMRRALSLVRNELEKGYPYSVDEDSNRIKTVNDTGDVKLIIATRLSNRVILQNTEKALVKKWLDMVATPSK